MKTVRRYIWWKNEESWQIMGRIQNPLYKLIEIWFYYKCSSIICDFDFQILYYPIEWFWSQAAEQLTNLDNIICQYKFDLSGGPWRLTLHTPSFGLSYSPDSIIATACCLVFLTLLCHLNGVMCAAARLIYFSSSTGFGFELRRNFGMLREFRRIKLERSQAIWCVINFIGWTLLREFDSNCASWRFNVEMVPRHRISPVAAFQSPASSVNRVCVLLLPVTF